MLGFFSFKTWILQGVEAMRMMKKIWIKDFFKYFGNDKIFIDNLPGITA